ncbi:MAG: BON domain-containing protein [Nitrospirae bacterium]|nr:MAG: BON domain-containing protein [Nitrospirota bacterium]
MVTVRRKMWISVALVALAMMAIGLDETVLPIGSTLVDQGNDQRQADAIIQSNIEKRLLLDERIYWELLHVQVNQGHAILYGEVRTPQEKGLAALIASTVPGLKGLTNSIIVEPAFTRDHKLSEAVWNVLQGVPTLNGNDTLRVNVKNSVVKLEGVVEHSIQKEAAEKAVASVSGVATVINLIEVKSQVSGESVTETVREKLLQEGVQVQP